MEVNGIVWVLMETETRERDKPADLRLVIPRELAREIRKRAKEGRRTIQAQVLLEIERGVAAANE